MKQPIVEKLPTSQMMKLCQVLDLKTDESRESMVAALNGVSEAQWTAAKVDFKVDQLK